MATTLITGATGFVGRHLLWQELRSAKPGDRVIAVIRATSQDHASARLAGILDDPSAGLSTDQKSAASAIPGDLQQDRLGFSPDQDQAIWPELTHIIHCAASVKFTLDLDAARAINVAGTRRVLQGAARACNLKRFDYIGTAYVAGARSGTISEDTLDLTGPFHNSYERTKAESEDLVRRAANDLPITVFRPSIVVGDSTTGITQNFNVLYWPLKVFARRLVLCIPADRNGIVDIVPIDYVRDAIMFIRRSCPAAGQTYHITCGPENTATIGGLAQTAAKAFGVWRPPFVSPKWVYPVLRPLLGLILRGRFRHVIETGDQFLPYLSHRALFDTSNTTAALTGTGIAPPPPAKFFDRLIAYCITSDWGRLPPP